MIRVHRVTYGPGWHHGRGDPKVAGAACERRRRLTRGTYLAIGVTGGLFLWMMQSAVFGVALAACLVAIGAWIALAFAMPPAFSLEREVAEDAAHGPLGWAMMFGPGVLFAAGGIPLYFVVQILSRGRGSSDELMIYSGAVLVVVMIVAALVAWAIWARVQGRRLAARVMEPGSVQWAFGSTWNMGRFVSFVMTDGRMCSIMVAGDEAVAAGLAELERLHPAATIGWTEELGKKFFAVPALSGQRG